MATTPKNGLFDRLPLLNVFKMRAGILTGIKEFFANNDKFTGSPGDWTRLIAAVYGGAGYSPASPKADSFMGNPSAEIYTGDPATGFIREGGSFEPGRKGDKLLRAALYYKLTGDVLVGNQARQTYLQQIDAKVPGTEIYAVKYPRDYVAYNSRTQSRHWEDGWGNPASVGLSGISRQDKNPRAFECELTGKWADIHYCLFPLFSAAEADKSENFLLDAGYYWMRQYDTYLDTLFVDRVNYVPSGNSTPYTEMPHPYYVKLGGAAVPAWTINGRLAAWNNRRANMAAAVGDVGYVLGNTELINSAKRYVKETIRFATFPALYEGAPVGQYTPLYEYHRWMENKYNNQYPEQGWQYAAVSLRKCARIAERGMYEGDTELLTHTTSGGIAQDKTLGGPKSLRSLINTHLSFVDGTNKVYCSKNSADVVNENPNFLMNGVSELQGVHYYTEFWFAGLNQYYRDANWAAIINRTKPGTKPAPPTSSVVGPYLPYDGPYGTDPLMSLTSVGLEDHPANPFLPANPTPTPTNLALNKPVVASVTAEAPFQEATRVVDGIKDNTSIWRTKGLVEVTVDLWAVRNITEVRVFFGVKDKDGRVYGVPKNFSIARSIDGVNFTNILSSTTNTSAERKKAVVTTARYTRLSLNNPDNVVQEFEIIGLQAAS